MGHEELYDLARGRPRGENGAHSAPKKFISVLLRNRASGEHKHVARPRFGEKFDDPWNQRQMGTRKYRQSDGIRIFFHRYRNDLLQCLMQTSVDDLHSRVPERPRYDLRPAVVTVETRLCHDNPNPLHRFSHHSLTRQAVRRSPAVCH